MYFCLCGSTWNSWVDPDYGGWGTLWDLFTGGGSGDQIGDTNVCEIKDGEVKMTEADCPDHLCMKQPAVGSAGGYIVCLPNRVVIQGEGDSDSQDSESGFDAVV